MDTSIESDFIFENNDENETPEKVSLDLNGVNSIDDIFSPSDLKFDEADPVIEDADLKEKKSQIELCINDENTPIEKWEYFAKSKGGLLNDNFRRHVWPLLVGVTEEEKTEPPSLNDLSKHTEYNQVVLDVNRSLKRFPPGIPYEQRVALQDQLTVLILRVIMKYPFLKYYQGYHDIAITLLLVCGDRASFPLLCRLSHGEKAPLAPFMQATMQPTQHRLNYMLPIIYKEDPKLAEYLEKSTVGTMFALPWYLTWFGHSLNKYTDVVRLYDYFLCAPPLFPVYVTAAIVMYRAPQVYECDCEMAMIHCTLSRLPDDLPFEDILLDAEEMYAKYDPSTIEIDVIKLEKKEEADRKAEEERKRKLILARNTPPSFSARLQKQMKKYLHNRLMRRLPLGTILATATVLVGVYAYYRPEFLPFSVNR